MRRLIAAILTHCLLIPCVAAGPPEKLQAVKVEQVLASKGTYNELEKVLKFSFPRSDVKATIDGVKLPAFMGLTTWCAFEPGMRKPAIVAGDVVLLEYEVNPVMSV